MKLSNLDFIKPNPPRLKSERQKEESRTGLSSVKTSLQQLFQKGKEDSRIITVSPVERVKKSLTNLFQRKPTPSQSEIPLREVENKTEIFSMQPSRRYLESVSQTKSVQERFIPEYLVRETPKEIFTPLKEEKRRTLFANLNLTLKGTLTKRDDGYYYLRIHEKLFGELIDLFPHDMISMPDFDFRLGPSISVILPHENPLGPVFEIGKEFPFHIKRALLVNQYDWPGVEKTLILTVGSAELVELRQSHGLSDKPNSRDFHLTLGIQRTTAPFTEKGFLRVHIGYHPV